MEYRPGERRHGGLQPGPPGPHRRQLLRGQRRPDLVPLRGSLPGLQQVRLLQGYAHSRGPGARHHPHRRGSGGLTYGPGQEDILQLHEHSKPELAAARHCARAQFVEFRSIYLR